MKNLKNPLLFTLALISIAVIAGYFTAIYSFSSLSEKIV